MNQPQMECIDDDIKRSWRALGMSIAFVVLVMAATLFTACAQLGMATPQTFNERLAAGYTSVSAVRDSAATLLTAGKIQVKDAENVQAQADNARAGLDLARGMSGTNPLAANDKLSATISLLTGIQQYLLTRQGAKP